MKPTKIVIGFALAGTIAATSCNPRFAGQLLGLAIVTAAIVGTASLLANHDGHFHDEYCGHHRRYYGGRWVYNYNGQWEYHESGGWYSYQPQQQAMPPPPPPPPPPGAY